MAVVGCIHQADFVDGVIAVHLYGHPADMDALHDAAYLELARRRGLPLATLNRELRAAARADNVALWRSGTPADR